MLFPQLSTPEEIQKELGLKAKERRLELNILQKDLSTRSGVPLSTIKRFEKTGQISLYSFIQLGFVLLECEKISELFNPFPIKTIFDQKRKKRKRSSVEK